MKKIPTIFERDWNGDRSRVIDKWAIDTTLLEGAIPTVKWDGTACLLKDGQLFKRYDAKHGKTPPPGFAPAQPEPDPETGHWPGWVPVLPTERWHMEAWAGRADGLEGTFELCGPKVQGNPHHLERHVLIPHGTDVIDGGWLRWPFTFDIVKAVLSNDPPVEGVVWWKDGAPAGKAKRRDFGLPWPVQVKP